MRIEEGQIFIAEESLDVITFSRRTCKISFGLLFDKFEVPEQLEDIVSPNLEMNPWPWPESRSPIVKCPMIKQTFIGYLTNSESKELPRTEWGHKVYPYQKIQNNFKDLQRELKKVYGYGANLNQMGTIILFFHFIDD